MDVFALHCPTAWGLLYLQGTRILYTCTLFKALVWRHRPPSLSLSTSLCCRLVSGGGPQSARRLSIRCLTERWAAAALSPWMPPSPRRPSGLIALSMEDLPPTIPGHTASSISQPHGPLHPCPTHQTHRVHATTGMCAECVRVHVCAH